MPLYIVNCRREDRSFETLTLEAANDEELEERTRLLGINVASYVPSEGQLATESKVQKEPQQPATRVQIVDINVPFASVLFLLLKVMIAALIWTVLFSLFTPLFRWS